MIEEEKGRVNSLLSVKRNTLYFDQCNMVELAEKYGTPLYVYSKSGIIGRIEELKECFLEKYGGTRVAYGAKAFCTKAMLKLCCEEGLCVDVVSGGELYTAVEAGMPAERIEFNGNNKSREELEMAIEYNIGRIIVDGVEEAEEIESVCRTKGKRAKILFRVSPDIEVKTHQYIMTGNKDSKFGIVMDEEILFPLVEKAINSEYLDFLGFHLHLGSQIEEVEPYLEGCRVMVRLAREVRGRFNYIIDEINLGGGFGVGEGYGKGKAYSYFIAPIMKELQEGFAAMDMKMPKVVIEPGRSLVADSGLTLYRVGNIKDIKGVRKYVALDGGMTDNIRPALYKAVQEGIVANKAGAVTHEKVTICGKCCESGDILIKEATVVQGIEKGDVFAILSTGAYGYSMASNYNRNLIPAVVMTDKGKSRLIVKRQTYQQLLENDL